MKRPIIQFQFATFFLLLCMAVFAGCNRAPKSGTDLSANSANSANDVARQTETLPSARARLGLHTQKTWMEFITQPRQLEANGFSIWLINVWQSGKTATRSRNRVPDFQMVRNKLMHVFVVSKDLSYFARSNPDHKGNGHFMLQQTLSRAGDFKIFVDYTPVDGQREVAQKTFKVAGAAPPTVELVPSPQVNGVLMQRVVSAPENESAAPANAAPANAAPANASASRYLYNVRLTLPQSVVARRGTEMRFRVANEQGAAVSDLEPYLGGFGQAVILSGDGEIFVDVRRADETNTRASYANEVAPDDSTDTRRGGPEVVFRATFPTPGLYKIWAQFRHRNRIITAPFVLSVAPALR